MISRRSLALVLVIGSLAAFPATAAAATPISVTVITGSPCVSGQGPKNSEVLATLRTPSGHMRGRFLTESDPDGFWGGCFPGAINGKDRLRVVIGDRDRTIAIPRLEPQIDRVENTINGWAPHDVTVLAQVLHRKNFSKTSLHSLETQSAGDGHYSFDTTGDFNLKGGDTVIVVAPHGNDLFGALVIVPFMTVLYADNTIVGTANNGTDLLLVLRDENGNLKADATAGTSSLFFGISAFSASLYDDDGDAAYLLGGDQLSANLASDASIQIPVSSLTGDPGTDVVRGRCMPNAPYGLQVGVEAFFGKTDATGRLMRDVGNRLNLRRGDSIYLSCLYPTGDTWSRTAIAL